jgi:hypothetical protein
MACGKGPNLLSVTAYSANSVAIGFYRTHGFAPFDMTLQRAL